MFLVGLTEFFSVSTELVPISFAVEMLLMRLGGFFLRKFEFDRSVIMVEALGETFDSIGGRRLLRYSLGGGRSTFSD